MTEALPPAPWWKHLQRDRPDQDLLDWARGHDDPEDAWRGCLRGDWIADVLDSDLDRPTQGAIAACLALEEARRAGAGAEVAERVLETVRAWLGGAGTLQAALDATGAAKEASRPLEGTAEGLVARAAAFVIHGPGLTVHYTARALRLAHRVPEHETLAELADRLRGLTWPAVPLPDEGVAGFPPPLAVAWDRLHAAWTPPDQRTTVQWLVSRSVRTWLPVDEHEGVEALADRIATAPDWRAQVAAARAILGAPQW